MEGEKKGSSVHQSSPLHRRQSYLLSDVAGQKPYPMAHFTQLCMPFLVSGIFGTKNFISLSGGNYHQHHQAVHECNQPLRKLVCMWSLSVCVCNSCNQGFPVKQRAGAFPGGHWPTKTPPGRGANVPAVGYANGIQAKPKICSQARGLKARSGDLHMCSRQLSFNALSAPRLPGWRSC